MTTYRSPSAAELHALVDESEYDSFDYEEDGYIPPAAQRALRMLEAYAQETGRNPYEDAAAWEQQQADAAEEKEAARIDIMANFDMDEICDEFSDYDGERIVVQENKFWVLYETEGVLSWMEGEPVFGRKIVLLPKTKMTMERDARRLANK